MGLSSHRSLKQQPFPVTSPSGGSSFINVWTNCAGYCLNSGLHVLLKSFTVTYFREETLDSKLVLSYTIPHPQIADELNVLS